MNTTIPKVIGAARRYELTGEPRYRHIAEYFWHEVTEPALATPPAAPATARSGTPTRECCRPSSPATRRSAASPTTCSSSRGSCSPGPATARTPTTTSARCSTASSARSIPAMASKLYYVPLASGYWKLFGTPLHDYWCCTGTGSESFAKLGDSIYFQDDDGLYVNLFIASELSWTERGVTVIQDTRFPAEPRTTVTIKTPHPIGFALRVRVPAWTARGGSARLNGKPLDSFAAPGGYLVLDRVWRDGDRLDVALPMALSASPTPDDPSVQAMLYGPFVLAARMGTAGLGPGILRAEPTKPRTIPEYKAEGLPMLTLTGHAPWLVADGRKPLTFHTAAGDRREFVPLYQILDERYGVYLKVPT